jgi:hypothetical protein
MPAFSVAVSTMSQPLRDVYSRGLASPRAGAGSAAGLAERVHAGLQERTRSCGQAVRIREEDRDPHPRSLSQEPGAKSQAAVAVRPNQPRPNGRSGASVGRGASTTARHCTKCGGQRQAQGAGKRGFVLAIPMLQRDKPPPELIVVQRDRVEIAQAFHRSGTSDRVGTSLHPGPIRRPRGMTHGLPTA